MNEVRMNNLYWVLARLLPKGGQVGDSSSLRSSGSCRTHILTFYETIKYH
ncbi:MAG: hypothetical protein H8D42_02235 [Candidatus Marinimicrobia bacterium]|nr:hypothetical protein [Candidatus Neomarinimicrobiota bacterium]